MSGEPLRTALVVLVEEADELVAPWRRRFDREAVERLIPAHVTILFPLVAATDVDDQLLSDLRALYSPVEPFEYELATVESFPGVAWLAPQPSAPFHGLIDRTRRAFPDHPPYGDPELAPVPHCTIAEADPSRVEAMLAELRPGLGPSLPIACRADAAWLLEERADSTWSRRASFPFERAR